MQLKLPNLPSVAHHPRSGKASLSLLQTSQISLPKQLKTQSYFRLHIWCNNSYIQLFFFSNFWSTLISQSKKLKLSFKRIYKFDISEMLGLTVPPGECPERHSPTSGSYAVSALTLVQWPQHTSTVVQVCNTRKKKWKQAWLGDLQRLYAASCSCNWGYTAGVESSLLQ